VPIVILSFIGSAGSTISYSLGEAVIVSAIISVVITGVFYRINIDMANDLLKKPRHKIRLYHPCFF